MAGSANAIGRDLRAGQILDNTRSAARKSPAFATSARIVRDLVEYKRRLVTRTRWPPRSTWIAGLKGASSRFRRLFRRVH